MAENLYRALWSWIICVLVTIIVSLLTKPKTAEELQGLVRAYTVLPGDGDVALYKRPVFWAVGVALMFAVLQIVFW
jgi:SSS family solute:Na+ symporter